MIVGAERRRGLRAQGLAAGERAGRRHDEAPGAPHAGAGGAAGQATSGGLAGRSGGPILQLSDKTYSSTLRGPGVSTRARTTGTPAERL